MGPCAAASAAGDGAPRQRTRGVRSVDGATPRAAVLLLLASGIRAQQAGNGGAPVAQVAEAHGGGTRLPRAARSAARS